MSESEQSNIHSPDTIYDILKKTQISKQLISLSFNSLPHFCLTSILEVQRKKQILIFDQPNPQLTSRQVAHKKEAKLTLKLNNLPLSFKVNLISYNQKKNIDELLTHFPKEIYYPQNRGYYRFRTEFIDDIAVTIFLSSTKRIPSQLIDLSIKGLRLRLPYSFAKKYKPNQVIEDIYICLPQQPAFSISAKVKYTIIENNHTNVSLGLEVFQPNEITEKHIQKFIFHNENKIT